MQVKDAAVLLFLPTRRELSRGGAAYAAGYHKLIAAHVKHLSALGLPLLLVSDSASYWGALFAPAATLPLVGSSDVARKEAALRAAERLGLQRVLCVWANATHLSQRVISGAIALLQQNKPCVGLTSLHRPYLLAGSIASLRDNHADFTRLAMSPCWNAGLDISLTAASSDAHRALLVMLRSLSRSVQHTPEAKPVSLCDTFDTSSIARAPPYSI